jgi:hypothetical protein
MLLMLRLPQLTRAHVDLNLLLLDTVSHTPTCCYAATEWRYSLTLLTNYHWAVLLVRVRDRSVRHCYTELRVDDRAYIVLIHMHAQNEICRGQSKDSDRHPAIQ